MNNKKERVKKLLFFPHATFLGCTEKRTLIFLQCPIHDQTKNGAGNHLTNSDCQHHKRNRKCYTITVTQYERNDDDIRNDWWKCCDNWFLLTQFPCKKCTDQCCNTAKYNIRKDRTPRILPIRHPTKSPGIAAGVNIGKIVSASEIRTCTSPKENGAKM